jgi:hypothetical protein
VPPLEEDNDSHGSNDANVNGTKKKETGSVSVAKWRRKKKGTAPDAVTCINTYFCVINVYMYQRNCSLVMNLGPPTKANLDGHTSPYQHVYEALLSQYLNEKNDDAALFAYPNHVFWTLTGTRCDEYGIQAINKVASSIVIQAVKSLLDTYRLLENNHINPISCSLPRFARRL